MTQGHYSDGTPWDPAFQAMMDKADALIASMDALRAQIEQARRLPTSIEAKPMSAEDKATLINESWKNAPRGTIRCLACHDRGWRSLSGTNVPCYACNSDPAMPLRPDPVSDSVNQG
jgi:hypothetical protein